MRKNIYVIWRVLEPLVIYFAISIITIAGIGFLLQMFLPIFGVDVSDFLREHTKLISAYSNVAGIVMPLPFLIHIYYKDGNRLNQNQMQDKRKQLFIQFYSLCIGVSASICLNYLFRLCDIFRYSDSYESTSDMLYSFPFYTAAIFYGMLIPFVEELLFRGILQKRVVGVLGKWGGILVGAVLFGLYHGNLPQFLYGCLMGILMGWLYEQTGQFVVPYAIHCAANLISVGGTYYPKTVMKEQFLTVIGIAGAVTILCVYFVISQKKVRLEK